jgi:hypothetical protein
MKITRRYAVASLLIIAVAIVLGAPAPASAGKVKGTQFTLKLYPTADSPSRNTTGSVTLWPIDYGPACVAVGVSVSKLAPNASYYMPVAWRYRDYWRIWHDQVYNVPIQTDARGNGGGGFSRTGGLGPSDFLIMPSLFQVYDSSGTLVLTSIP